MHRNRAWHSLLVLTLLVGLLAACQTTGGGAASFYQGDVRTTETAVAEPLRFELWQVQYQARTTSRDPSGALVIGIGGTNVFVKVQNTGNHTALLFEAAPYPPNPEVRTPPPDAYLTDQQGRRYPTSGGGWSQPAGEPEEHIGKALPGQTAEAVLMFPPMPRDVTALTLHWNVRLEDGTPLSVTLPVPLPKTPAAEG